MTSLVNADSMLNDTPLFDLSMDSLSDCSPEPRVRSHVSSPSPKDDLIFERPKDTLVEFLVYGYAIFYASENEGVVTCDNYNLMVMRNDCRGIKFYELYDSFDVERFEDNPNVRMRIKCFDLNIDSDIKINHPIELLRRDVAIMLDMPIYISDDTLHFCVCIQRGDELIMWAYDPYTKTEYKSDSGITHSKFLPDYLNGWRRTRIIVSNETLDFDGLNTRILKEVTGKFNLSSVKTEELKEGIKSLFDIISLNYSKIIDRTRKSSPEESATDTISGDNFDGWSIDRCYLDANSANSLSSFAYLDDATIDFFNEFTRKYIMSSEQQQHWCILSTFFLRKISQYKDSKEAYENTWRWTRKIKRPLSLHDIIFIPINLYGIHWSLVIIAYPKFAIRCTNAKAVNKRPCIIYLDSLGNCELETKTRKMLRNYLLYEYESRCKMWSDKGFEFISDPKWWDYVGGSKQMPLQENGHDCGVYVLEYIRHLVNNPHLIKKLLDRESALGVGDKRPWFTQKQIHQRRINMKKMLMYMKENPNWENNPDGIQYLIGKMVKQY